MEHHSMSDKDFHTRYGVTPREVEDALDENRRRVARRLSEWGYAWAVDEIMCDVAVELLKEACAGGPPMRNANHWARS